MLNGQQKLQHIIDISLELAQIKDFDILLDKILKVARRLVNADAGYIFIKENGTLKLSQAQNDTLQQALAPGKKLALTAPSIPVSHHSIFGYIARTGEMVNIPDVSQIPEDAPYVFDDDYDKTFQYHTRSLLAIPLKNTKQEIIGVMQLLNAKNDAGEIVPFPETDFGIIRLFMSNASHALERAQLTRSRIMGMIRVLTELRDTEETAGHVNRIGAYAAEIYEMWAHKKDIPIATIDANKDVLRMAAMLHDLGKLAIPDGIQRKPGKLSAEEYEIMKQHTVKGAQLLLKYAQSDYENAAAQIALNHHEHWDGTGYPGFVDPVTGGVIPGYEDPVGKPRKKAGEEIPIFDRIVAVADVYDALTCRRIYRDAWQEEDVLQEIQQQRGKYFDPEVVDAFFAILDVIRAIQARYPDPK